MEKTRLTFLGTGTSQGIPIIGCSCKVCRSADSRDKRFRASAYVEYGDLKLLVDAGPDFRMQMLAHGLHDLDGILLTHNHKDHTGGLDDVRSLNYIDHRATEIYCERNVLEDLIREYPYVFRFPKYPGAPEWRLNVIDDRPFLVSTEGRTRELVWIHDVGYHFRMPDGSLVPTGNSIEDIVRTADRPGAGKTGAPVIPIRGLHGTLPVLGFRFGDIAYLTDMSAIPDEEFDKLKGLKHVTLNTVSYKPHHSHFSLEEAVRTAGRIGAEHTWLTHLSHTFPQHASFCAELRDLCRELKVDADVQPAYDGLVIE